MPMGQPCRRRVAAAGSIVLAAGAHAGVIDSTVDVVTAADAAVQYSGALGYSVVDGPTNRTARSGGNNVRNSVYEFSLASIPAGATITGASLVLETAGLISNTSNPAEVAFDAWHGDGVVTDADHQNLTAGSSVATELYQTGGATPIGTMLTIDFASLSAIQSAVDASAPFLTVRSRTVNFVTFTTAALENADGRLQPTLRVTYIPAPATAAALAGLVALRRRR